MMQHGFESATQRVQEASEQFIRAIGFSGQDGERFADQSKRDMEAVMRCGTVLTHAFHDMSRSWLSMGQKQWQRNLDGFKKLGQSKSLQEFAAVQSEMMRQNLQQSVQGSRAMAETTLRAIDEASKSLSGTAPPEPSAS